MDRQPEAITKLRRALGERMSAHRKLAGLSQGDLGRKLYCDRTAIARLEQGQRTKDQRFWQQADDVLHADGALLRAFSELEAAKAEHERRRLEAERDTYLRQIATWQQQDSHRRAAVDTRISALDPAMRIASDGDLNGSLPENGRLTARLHAMRARGLATRGEERECRNALETAQNILDHPGNGEPPLGCPV
jgi:transcriptional regulator with XRE-family HTH domain